jgi:chromosome segregation protein
LQIKELRLSGFKSFVDPVRLHVEAGLSGIVGPNGCGKSNLLEAVRWVMGATSAKAMRAGDMDDVIFAGTEARPAREHAEVVMVLEADGAALPPGVARMETLEVSRKIKREAGSTYRINGKEVRAKDVQLLFADASTGANSPALVRQGQISELIAAKPENRRRVLEEAAGTAGLHARRHEADLKLKGAEANLARLDEVLGEIEAQTHNLKRQARQAERYRGLADEIRKHEALMLHRRFIEAREHRAACDAALREAERAVAEAARIASEALRAVESAQEALAPLREEELIAAAVLRKLEVHRANLERDVADANAAVARAEETLARLHAEDAREREDEAESSAALARLDEEESALKHGEDGAAIANAEADAHGADAARRAAEAALEDAARAFASAQAEYRTAENRWIEAKARVAKAEASGVHLAKMKADAAAPADWDTRMKAAQTAASDARAAQQKAQDALASAENALQIAVAEARVAESAFAEQQRKQNEIAAEIKALDKVLAVASAKFPPAWEKISVVDGFERALAAALGEDGDASLDEAAPSHWRAHDVRDIAWPPGCTPLRDHVSAPKALQARLGACALVERGDGARIAALLPPGARMVSKEGDLWRWDGLTRSADAPAPAAIRLEQTNRLKAARRAESKLAIALGKTREAHNAASEAMARAQGAARAAAQGVPIAMQTLSRAEAHEAALIAEAQRRADRQSEITRQTETLKQEMEALREAVAHAERAKSAPPDESGLNNARGAAEAARKIATETGAALAILQRARTARLQRLSAIAEDRARWNKRKAQSGERLTALHAQFAKEEAALNAARATPIAAAAQLEILLTEIKTSEARAGAARDALESAERLVRERDAFARKAEEAHSACRENRAGANARVSAADERLALIEAQAQDLIAAPAAALADRAGALIDAAIARAPIGDVERKLERLKHERDAAGPVNLRADEELAEAQKRLDDLTREKADVVGAIMKLKQAIGRLNAEARQRLLAAFEKINVAFGQLFATLFEGGEAHLRLTDHEDPLLAGLEIYACPPGKRLSTLSLMSGGEQALTATALIFAVFLGNPAPICVLDEVDAPLDDANVDRYCRLLDEMRRRTDTRFLVITHNPVTMSRMDRLFGVTMGERGVSQIVSVDLRTAEDLVAAE